MKNKIIISGVIILLIFFSLFLWWNQAVKPPNPTDNKSVIFSIKTNEKIKIIADRLEKEGLIRSPLAFFILSRFGGLGDHIQAGDFRLNPSMDLFTLSNTLTHGTLDTQITIPEGWRNEEIALLLTRELNIPESEFLKIAREGYMFPDTYQIPKDSSVENVAKIFSANFDKKVSNKLAKDLQNKNLTLDEVIIIASLIEREVKYQQDRPLVAGIILNRLNIGMKLDIDATIQYALGYQPKEKSWWKKTLTIEDIEFDSPYNTYKNAGLPPKPISNPGLLAIEAVLNAPINDYLYYISDKSGKIHPARNIEEHNINITKYLNI